MGRKSRPGLGFRSLPTASSALPSALYAMPARAASVHGCLFGQGWSPAVQLSCSVEHGTLGLHGYFCGGGFEQGAEERLQQIGPLSEQVEQVFAVDFQRRAALGDDQA